LWLLVLLSLACQMLLPLQSLLLHPLLSLLLHLLYLVLFTLGHWSLVRLMLPMVIGSSLRLTMRLRSPDRLLPWSSLMSAVLAAVMWRMKRRTPE
jgi:hypothetical protein